MSCSRQLFRRPLVGFRQLTRDTQEARTMRTRINLIHDLLRCLSVEIIHHDIGAA
jgi:hypothetical protein